LVKRIDVQQKELFPKPIEKSDLDSAPADLSVLTEEKLSSWTEGCDMTHEMALQTFLEVYEEMITGISQNVSKIRYTVII
jgi:hypothetical protein